MRRGKCPKTGKRQYKTQFDCLRANMKRPIMARAYLCECGSWHVTRNEQQ